MRLILLFIVLLTLSGCTQTIIEVEKNYNETMLRVHVKVNTFLKDIEFDELWYTDVFGVRKYVGLSPDVKAITPYGTIKLRNNRNQRRIR